MSVVLENIQLVEKRSTSLKENITRLESRKIIQAWKDENFRATLLPAELAMLPEHPAGSIEVGDTQIQAAGDEVISWDGCTPPLWTNECCPTIFGHPGICDSH